MTTAELCDTQPTVLRIEGEMSIYRAEELKRTLLTALEQAPLLEVDLAAVTELDSAGVQLLMLAKACAKAGNRELRLVAHSQAVADVFKLLDLGSYFGDPLAISPHPFGTVENELDSLAGHSYES